MQYDVRTKSVSLHAGRVRRLVGLLGSLVVGACSIVGVRSGTEEPAYSVVGQAGLVEIRQYGPRAAAETTVDATEMAARSEGFQRLAGYIFGKNAGGTSVAMTAPVAQASTIAMTAPVMQSGSVIRFFLPSSLTAETAPRPIDARVRIVTVPAETIAVLRYSGSTRPEAVAEQQARLVSVLAGNPYQVVGTPFSWFYDPPWTLPPLRRNEAVVQVRALNGTGTE